MTAVITLPALLLIVTKVFNNFVSFATTFVTFYRIVGVINYHLNPPVFHAALPQ